MNPISDTVTVDTSLDSAPAAAAARRLYCAELALHDAHASGVDAWIAAAAERLHEAVVDHLRVCATFRTAA